MYYIILIIAYFDALIHHQIGTHLMHLSVFQYVPMLTHLSIIYYNYTHLMHLSISPNMYPYRHTYPLSTIYSYGALIHFPNMYPF